MSNVEYLKLFHRSYLPFCHLVFLSFLASAFFCSHSYAIDFHTTGTECPSTMDSTPEEELNTCFSSHAEQTYYDENARETRSKLNSTVLARCTYALRNQKFCPTSSVATFADAPIINEQLRTMENERQNSRILQDAETVFYADYCGVGEGTINEPKPPVGMIQCANLGKLIKLNGGTFKFRCDSYVSNLQGLCRDILSKVDTKTSCLSNAKTRLYCEDIIDGFLSSNSCANNLPNCSLDKIEIALTSDPCEINNYSRENCTGSAEGNDRVRIAGCADHEKVNGKCPEEGPGNDCGANQERNSSGQCVAVNPIDDGGDDDKKGDDTTDDGTNDDGTNDDGNPDNSDYGNLANLADNLGNQMFGNQGGGGSGGNISGGGNLPKIDVKGSFEIGGYQDGTISAAGDITSQGAVGPMSAALAFPQPVVANPGGKSKAGAGGNGGGGPRGGGFGGVGGNNNLGNGGGGAKGSSGGQRRSRGGMPYADIRNNLGGTSYHGATGTPNNAVAVEAAGTKSKKGNNPQVPNVEEDGNYQVALNGAFQRGLSKADALDPKMTDGNTPCNSTSYLFSCISETSQIIRRQGVLNAKGR